ncbi:MAG: hypothetical protein ACO1NO_11645 [Burkholderiaceae bacterium]
MLVRHAVIVLLVCLEPVLAATAEELAGVWTGADTAATSLYGSIRITPEHISWPMNHNYPQGCLLSYSLENEASGITFRNQTGQEFVTGPDMKFVTHLLRIDDSDCALRLSKLRLTFPDPNDPDFLELVEYDLSGEAIGWMHFTR